MPLNATAGSGRPSGEPAAGSPVLGIMVGVTESQELPGSVLTAYERADRAGFQLACEVEVGRLLARAHSSGERIEWLSP